MVSSDSTSPLESAAASVLRLPGTGLEMSRRLMDEARFWRRLRQQKNKRHAATASTKRTGNRTASRIVRVFDLFLLSGSGSEDEVDVDVGVAVAVGSSDVVAVFCVLTPRILAVMVSIRDSPEVVDWAYTEMMMDEFLLDSGTSPCILLLEVSKNTHVDFGLVSIQTLTSFAFET